MNDKHYFDEVARQWDRMRESLFSDRVRGRAFSIANIQSGKVAADIGCGTGFITEGLIRKGLKVIAVDQSEEMLNEMRRKFQRIDAIDYRRGESENLPVEDESVDYVFANMYLHHVDSPGVAIREMVRILRPGGKIVITDLDEHDFDFLKIEHYDRWMGFKREDIRKWLTEAGLGNVIVDCTEESCCAQSTCGKESASVSIFIAIGEK